MLDHGFGGREPHALSEEGRAQAARIAEALKARAIAAVLSSPVQRAQETAAAIGSSLGRTVEVAPEFTEIDCGNWTGATFEKLRGLPAWRAWNSFRSTAAIPGGETMLAVQTRAVAGVVRLAATWPSQEVVVVSHADVIKAVLAHFLGMPLDLMRRMEIAPASISRLLLQDEDAKVLSVNLPS